MLSNAYFLAKFRFDTAENEPVKYCKNLLILLILLTLTLRPFAQGAVPPYLVPAALRKHRFEEVGAERGAPPLYYHSLPVKTLREPLGI